MECLQCGATLPDGKTRCSYCGADVERPERAQAGEETHRLLAEANLCRLRGQYDEAISVCTRILRLEASSAAAHSLLGDIYREQGNYHEALGWYKLAVQLNPTSHSDRSKLDEMIDHVFQGAVRSGEGRIPHLVAPTPPPADAKQRTAGAGLQQLLLRIQPIHIVATFAVLAAVLAIMVLVKLHGASATASRPTPAPRSATPAGTAPITTGTPTGTGPTQVTAPPPDKVESGSSNNKGLSSFGITVRPSDEQNTTPGNAAHSTAPVTTGPVVHEVPPLVPPGGVQPAISSETISAQTEELKATLGQIARALPLSSKLDSVTIDPRTGNTTIEYSIPRMAGPTETKQGLLYVGFNLVWTAMEKNTALRSFTLRGNAYSPPNNPPTIALTADVTPAQAQAVRSASDYAVVQSFLTNPWWRSDLSNAGF
ncbi:MAG TPA: tetratricopeptide repeat protein [Armatimonadota bacterium]